MCAAVFFSAIFDRMKFPGYLLLLFAGFMAVAVPAQEPTYYHYSVKEGLPSSEIYDIIQDRSGFIWVATDRGVSRYDGYEFFNFSTQDGLTDNTVFNLQEDSKGRLWCITSNNRLCYFSGDSIVAYRYNDALLKFIGTNDRYKNIRSFLVDEQDNVLLGFLGESYVSISNTGKTERKKINGNSKRHYNFDFRFVNGKLAMTCQKLEDPQTDAVFTYDFGAGRKELVVESSPMRAGSYFVGTGRRDGSVVLGTAWTIYYFREKQTPLQIEMPGPIIRIYEDTDESLWISMRQQGTMRFPKGQIPGQAEGRRFLPGKTVSAMFRDREGGMWFGTLEHGLYYQPSPNVKTFFSEESGLPHRIVSICKGPGNIVYAATVKGKVLRFTSDSLTGEIDLYENKNTLELNKDICYDARTNRLIAVTESNMVEIDFDASPAYKPMGGHLGGNRAVLFDPADPSFIWIGRQGYVIRLAEDQISKQPGRRQVYMFNSRIDVLCFTKRFGLLTGTSDGLFVIDKDSARRLFPGEDLLRSRISAIAELPDGSVAFGTIGRGLLILQNGKVKQFTVAEGLPSNILNALALDEDGLLWAGTNRGVSRIELENDSIHVHNYTVANGLPTNEVRELMASGPFLWIGTSDGLCILNRNDMQSAGNPPLIILRKILVNGTERMRDSLASLRYNENMLDVIFTGLSYKSKGDILYRYRLSGADTGWRYTRNTSVRFMSLSPGDYTFEMYARNSDGLWSSRPVRFTFCITQPYWRKWWFIISVSLAVLVLSWFLFSARVKRLREKEMMKRRIVEYQQKALASQMNPHFIFNSLNSIQAFVLGDDKESVMKYISRFSLLLRRSLDNSMEPYVSLRDDLDVLRAYLDLESMRFKEKINCEVRPAPALDLSRICIPAMLIQPYAENAIRHGLLHKTSGTGSLVIGLEMENGNLVCSVDDNGVGRELAEKLQAQRVNHRSAGTSITGERLELLCREAGKDYFFEIIDKKNAAGEALGTTVRFFLPYTLR
ncbi:MAG: putative signal transduction histidine kinase [Bacteroidetes bacterium]|nr:MAG: putative signal transduction histidine kinase [Bacteroidota bacterium]